MPGVKADEWKAMAMKQDVLITKLRAALRRATMAARASLPGAVIAACYSSADVDEWQRLADGEPRP